MNTLFKNVGLVLRPDTVGIHDATKTLVSFLKENQINVYIEDESLNDFSDTDKPDCSLLNKEVLGKLCDLIIVLGGDGTLLSVARKIAPYRVPLIGINQGRLGFMTDISKENMIPALEKMFIGEFVPEERIMLEASVLRNNKEVKHALALNDVVFSRGSMGQMIEFELFIDEQFVYTQRSDGLIVSSPTGSTAYALSSGGPILQPTLPAFTLVPICPQAMNNRPIVINDTAQVCFLLTKGGDTRVHFDGQSLFDLAEMDQVFIRRYRNTLRMLHPQDYNYYHTLRQKLHWGERLI
ncbi:NAD(+) kinase [Neisseria sp. Ec49-e6-T10]|uniref:NAD(+) kinase n=1 Tax=Neisseria sp. Ec49-e6-T10 TaxID=3140744 RepID=UPI003EC10E2E